MSGRVLDANEIKALLAPRAPKKAKTPQAGVSSVVSPYAPIEQIGPLRYFDDEMRCLTRNEGSKIVCRSPTHYKLYGVPTCHVHALRRMNELLAEPGQL